MGAANVTNNKPGAPLISRRLFEPKAESPTSLGFVESGSVDESMSAHVREIIHAFDDDATVEEIREGIRAAGDDPDAPKRILPYRISDEARDLHGTRFLVRGWKLQRYRANPTILFGHDGRSLPIGRSARIWRDGSKDTTPALRALAQFNSPELDNGLGDTIFRMARAGVLNGASIGFEPEKWERDPQLDELPDEEKAKILRKWGGGILFRETTLLEWSVVPIPSNPNALKGRAGDLGDTRAYVEAATRALDGEDSTIFAPWLAADEGSRELLQRSMSILTPEKATFAPQSPPRDPYRGVPDDDVVPPAPEVNDASYARTKSIFEIAAAINVTAEEELRELQRIAMEVVRGEDRVLTRLQQAKTLIDDAIERSSATLNTPDTDEPDPDPVSIATEDDILRALAALKKENDNG